MKASAAAQAFKSLASRIHPQLPLSERESQRLLTALTSSFRSQLDHHTHSHDAPASTQHSSSSSTATDNHLASILTNPLLTKPVHSQLKDKSKHPIALFDDQVAAGRATIDSARLCLEAFRSSLDGLSSAQVTKQTQHYAAGTRALRWLWSSASVSSLSFVHDQRFCNHLTYFLIQEGRENALWELLETNISASAHLSARDVSKRKGLLLCSIVKGFLSLPVNPVSSALGAFFCALESRQSSHISFSQAGIYLSHKLVNPQLAHSVDVALYDRFVDSVPQWNKNHPDRAVHRMANMKLHHPVAPSADAALNFIRALKPLASHPFLKPTTAAQRTVVFNFFFDTVKLLQKEGRFDDALWVMEFMQQRFPSEFASPDSHAAKVASSALHAAETSGNASPETILPDWRAPEMG